MIKTVLIVDDSKALAQSLADILTMEGFAVTIVGNGMMAFSFLHKSIPDIIITDLIMPEMSGIDLIKNIRNDEKYRVIPIIALSADTREERSKEGREAGADLFFTKPFDENILLEAIEKLIKK